MTVGHSCFKAKMHRNRTAIAVAMILGIAPATRAQVSAASVGGLWESDGYGLLFDVVRDTLRSYEVTAVSCLPGFSAAPVAAPAGALRAFKFIGGSVTVLLLPDQDATRIRLHFNGAASDVVLHRASQKPAWCDHPAPNTPQSNFEIFARNWSEQYPFFAQKHVDWAAVVETNRRRVTDSTTPAELFAMLKGMIEPLNDAHTSINAGDIGQRFSGSRTGGTHIANDQYDRAYATVSKYLTADLHTFCAGQLEFGMLAPDIGYLRIRSFGRYDAEGTFESGLVTLEAALDTIFAGARTWKGFVIDVRINGGGADPYGLAIAGRLSSKDYVAYLKEARLDPIDASKWTPAQTSWVRASSRPGFTGPVVELTGLRSVSAAETFTQALFNRERKVIRVGENTQGVFSDVLGRRLPNGWRFGLPNERFVTDGKSYDGPGIPPDVEVAVFPASDLDSGRDGAVERALVILGARQR
jgi:Peptidase family S41